MANYDKDGGRSTAATLGVGHILPLEVVDKCIGRQLWVLMKGEKEFYGRLKGFDDYLNMALEDVKEFAYSGLGSERVLTSQHKSMLLNGAHICMMIPGENQDLEKFNTETATKNKTIEESKTQQAVW